MMTAATRTPTVLYAQDKTQIFLTIDLADVKEHVLKTENNSVSFSTEKDGVSYGFSLELYDSIKDWSVAISTRNIALVGLKEKVDQKFWPRLNETGKLAYVKTDFSKWIDEDEEDEEVPQEQGGGNQMNEQLMRMMQGGGMGGMGGGMPGMGGMGGMPGMPDMSEMLKGMPSGAGKDTNVNIEEVDSDDELPELEAV